MLEQRLRESADAVKAALADTVPPAPDDVFGVESPTGRNRVGWRGPLIAAGAAAAVLVVVAAAAFLLRGERLPGEPLVTLPAPVVTTSVTTTVPTAPAVVGDAVGPWGVAKLAEPWVTSIVDVASLPAGGFVVAVDHSEHSVLWSLDGMEWEEADPLGQVSAAVPEDRWFPQQPQVVTVSGDHVFILDEANLRVWVGNLEAKAWEAIRLDAAGLTGSIDAAAIASHDDEVLVVAKWAPIGAQEAAEYSAEYYGRTDHVVWLIDPETGRARRQTLPLDPLADFETDSNLTDTGLAAVWFQDRWVIAMGNVTAVSSDGITWTLGWDPDGLAKDKRAVTSLVAGSDGLITTTCGGFGPHFTFYSEDGLQWTQVPDHEQFREQAQSGHGGAAYSDDLGFVMVFADSSGDWDELGRVDYSRDGQSWSSSVVGLRNNNDVFNVAASGATIFVGHSILTAE